MRNSLKMNSNVSMGEKAIIKILTIRKNNL